MNSSDNAKNSAEPRLDCVFKNMCFNCPSNILHETDTVNQDE